VQCRNVSTPPNPRYGTVLRNIGPAAASDCLDRAARNHGNALNWVVCVPTESPQVRSSGVIPTRIPRTIRHYPAQGGTAAKMIR
jgi:hypothetical protein